MIVMISTDHKNLSHLKNLRSRYEEYRFIHTFTGRVRLPR